MASVVVRNLSEETKGRLVARAARNRRSLEEELRQILDATARAEVPCGRKFFEGVCEAVGVNG